LRSRLHAPLGALGLLGAALTAGQVFGVFGFVFHIKAPIGSGVRIGRNGNKGRLVGLPAGSRQHATVAALNVVDQIPDGQVPDDAGLDVGPQLEGTRTVAQDQITTQLPASQAQVVHQADVEGAAVVGFNQGQGRTRQVHVLRAMQQHLKIVATVHRMLGREHGGHAAALGVGPSGVQDQLALLDLVHAGLRMPGIEKGRPGRNGHHMHHARGNRRVRVRPSGGTPTAWRLVRPKGKREAIEPFLSSRVRRRTAIGKSYAAGAGGASTLFLRIADHLGGELAHLVGAKARSPRLGENAKLDLEVIPAHRL
jgi:hypothetical protein